MDWLKQLFSRRRIYSDISEEIQQHLVERTEALMAEGMSRAEAEKKSRREFGNVTGIEEQSRDAWARPIADSLWTDAKFAMRQLRKNSGFALTAILTLALGIGATSAILSLVNAVLLRPLPFPEPDRLVWTSQQNHSLPGIGDGVVDHPMREVIGVVGDIKRRGLTAAIEPQFYLPYSQAIVTNPFLTIRASGDTTALQGALREVVHELDKSVPVYQVATLDDYVAKSAAMPRFQTLLLTCFAGIALLLAAIGLFGLLSYMVVQRTLEIGVRMALGARQSDVLGMIVRRGLTLALIGLGPGLVISAIVTRLLSGMLYGIRPSDPLTFGTMTGVLLLVSFLASSIPAYRAAQLDPIETLREQ